MYLFFCFNVKQLFKYLPKHISCVIIFDMKLIQPIWFKLHSIILYKYIIVFSVALLEPMYSSTIILRKSIIASMKSY